MNQRNDRIDRLLISSARYYRTVRNIKELGSSFQTSEQRLVRTGHESLAAKFFYDVK